uniref:PH domain-containing protein n=2 Tax=Meloidogyne TaxID=189290 RepID=A0A915LVQ3_MELJA
MNEQILNFNLSLAPKTTSLAQQSHMAGELHSHMAGELHSHMAGVSLLDKQYTCERQLKAVLPPLDVWKRVLNRGSFRFASLDVTIKRRGLFGIERAVSYGIHTCVLSKQGHLVIYTDNWKHEGFTVNLSKAARAEFKCKTQKQMFLSTTTQRICNVRVKWNFGSIKIRLPESLVLDWGRAILEAARGKAEASYESRHYSSTVHYRPTTPILFENGTQTDSTVTFDGNVGDIVPVPSVRAPKSDDGIFQLLDPDDSFGELISYRSDDESLHLGEMFGSNDQSINTAKEQEMQPHSVEKKEDVDHDENEEKIPFPLEKALLLNFPSENKEQQQEDYIPESAVISSGSLRRRVTFSDLNTIFEAPENEDPVEEDETSELKQDDVIPKIGCNNRNDVKDTEGIEERRKEHIVQLALDQMRIVGQHGVKETTTAEEVSIKDENGKNANEDIQHETGALQPCEQMTKTNDGDNFVSTQQLALKMQFPSQSDRFDRTRCLFEHGTGGVNTDEEDDKETNKQ